MTAPTVKAQAKSRKGTLNRMINTVREYIKDIRDDLDGKPLPEVIAILLA